MPAVHLLINALVNTSCVGGFNEMQWDLLIRQARAANLLARLDHKLADADLDTRIPGKIKRHFNSDVAVADAIGRSVRWEVQRIEEALSPLSVNTLLLKGSVYVLAGLQAGRGRTFQDTDILTPKTRLDDVETMLKWHGWIDGKTDEYDQRYYRIWMHELPPKHHNRRGSVLDVHHNILPETCKICPDANKLIDSAVKIPNTNYWMLAPCDMVLHSASHLFWDGEFDNGLRDLSDMDLLLREFSEMEAGFWQQLIHRAEELGLDIPLFYALRYTSKILLTPVPCGILQQSSRHYPVWIRQKIMDFLFIRALMPNHDSCNDRWTGLARWLLFVRSHWLKMPVFLLVPHLLRKSLMRLTGKAHH
jgi:hypothetical protein